MILEKEISINLDTIRDGLCLIITERRAATLFDGADSAAENNEARYQLIEGCYYDYELSDSRYVLVDPFGNIVLPHKRKPHLGTIAPNIYVGTLEIPLKDTETGETVENILLEVQSLKSGYREDYRDMLELITEKCTDLLLQANAPVSHSFDIDYSKNTQTLYQRFAFVKSVIATDEFAEAVHRIVTMPVTQWKETAENKDIRNARRFTNTNIRELLKSGNRTKLPQGHFLKNYGIETLPERITTIRKMDSVDTPENRFIKHALEIFLKFSAEIHQAAIKSKQKKLENEAKMLVRILENKLQHSIFNEISRPTTLKLNSPVLQRKEGYREVLRVWLMFDLAAKLIWKGGEDVYGAGKKDIATLYEYWLFFKLLDLFQEIFHIEPSDISDLIQPTTDGLSLQIKQGKSTPLRGVYDSGIRKLNIRFNYNRSFSGKKEYPLSGSWTTTLRPDYTLSLWPLGISESEAEKQELIVHIHFDAKYKVANLWKYLDGNSEEELDDEKTENKKGIYKNADLLKMHAYKDAIRRTGGAYILYPGENPIERKGFHEIIPGLGAFPVRPSKTDTGIGDLKKFILEIIDHFINRASQREKMAFKTFTTHKYPPRPEDVVRHSMPEAYNDNRDLIPDDTFVMVGFYDSTEQYDWIKRNKLYNFRIGSGRGSLILDNETLSSKYLLLHTHKDKVSGDLWKIVSKGPKIWSRETMLAKNYLSPTQDYYLIVEIEKVEDLEFKNVKWDFKNLSKYKTNRASALPFTVSLTELMNHSV